MGRVDGKVAIITGAGSGIGAGTARVMGREGARVVCADLDQGAAEVTAKEIEAAGGKAIAIRLDVTDQESNNDAAAQAVEQYGGLHIAHLNAGLGTTQPIFDITLEEWDRVMNVNLRGVMLGLQSFGRAISESGGGAIVATASGAGLLGGQSMGTYCATKFGVVGLVKCAAADLAPYRIRVNCVCPGVIDTPILGAAHGNASMMDFMGTLHPLGRVGQPEEVGQLVTFLASDDAAFITGGAYPVDGGITATIGTPRRN